MVQCYKCKHCIGFIPEDSILCENTKNPEGFRFVNWKCAYDDEEGCSSYEPNLHDNSTARQSPETRDNGIHKKE